MPPEIELLHFGGVFAQHRQTQAQQCRQSLTGKPHENDDNDDDRTTAGYNSHEEVRADKSGKRRCDGGSHGADQGHAISSGPILCVPATPPRQVVDPTEKLDENWRCQKGDLNRQQHQQQSQRAYFAGPSDTPTRAKKRARHVNDGNNDGRGNLYILQHDDGLEHTPSRTRLLALGSQQQRWPRRRRLLSSSSPDSGGRCGSGAGESSGSEMIDTLHSYIRKKRQDTASLLRRLQEVEQGLREREVQIDRQQKQLTQSQQECAFLRQRVEQMQRADGGGGALCAGCGMAAW
ncbi:hypothetical protein HDU83_008420 [Entophlyctis luteolus]|nr:hypothetical protein HDU83_008420 [Entophlyctis luteolus]